MVFGFRKLRVWQTADELAYQVYQATKAFPRDEIHGLTSQLRRSVVSVPTNIVEGMGRQSEGQTKHFLGIALGSLAEVEYLLSFSLRLRYLSENQYNSLDKLRHEVGAMLWKFYKSF